MNWQDKRVIKTEYLVSR